MLGSFVLDSSIPFLKKDPKQNAHFSLRCFLRFGFVFVVFFWGETMIPTSNLSFELTWVSMSTMVGPSPYFLVINGVTMGSL